MNQINNAHEQASDTPDRRDYPCMGSGGMGRRVDNYFLQTNSKHMKKTALQQMIDDLYDTNSSFGGETMISRMRVATIIRSYLATEREQIERAFTQGVWEGVSRVTFKGTGRTVELADYYFTKTYENEQEH